MKKILLLLTGLMLSITSFSQSYRGMLDIYIGVPVSGEKTFSELMIKNKLGFAVTTTHGCQITKSLFAGLGLGITYEGMTVNDGEYWYHTNTLPLFIDLRWDLDIRKKITPFVDLKGGYQLRMLDGAWFEGESGVEAKNSIYIQPTAGVRFRTGKKTGLNVGLSYIPLKKSFECHNSKPIPFSTAFLMLNLGFDF